MLVLPKAVKEISKCSFFSSLRRQVCVTSQLLRENKVKFSKRAFILFLIIIFCIAPFMAAAIETGAQAPDFKLTSVAGQEVSLSDFKGQLVLLKLATTWCPTCKQLSAEINKAGEFLKEKNVVFLEVFVQDSEEMIEKYLGDEVPPMTFHALLDDESVYEAYNVYLIPRFLVIDAEQVVRFDSSGRNVLAADITAMVEDFSPPVAADGST
jgi:peroxiredoxin